MVFRLLRADEIDVRVGQVKESGCSLLLYKDARCDMNILDESVGALNWTREHGRDNANCVVSVWDEKKSSWVSKEDTGVESNTEKEKGLASDSFKRACVNWGIGRELYTAPFIWIESKNLTMYDTGRKDRYNKPVYGVKDKFAVEKIKYDEKRNIIGLSIINQKKVRVFVYCDESAKKEKA